jgi:thiamine transport system substrate-binding protein
VVSYGSSPPAEVIFADKELREAPTASIVEKNMCYRQVEYAGILNGTKERELAENFIDFMLDVPFLEEMPLQMFVFPVNTKAQLPEEFVMYAQIPDEPASLDPELISQLRDKWIQDWTLTVLR